MHDDQIIRPDIFGLFRSLIEYKKTTVYYINAVKREYDDSLSRNNDTLLFLNFTNTAINTPLSGLTNEFALADDTA